MMSRIRSGSLGTEPDAPVVSLRHSPEANSNVPVSPSLKMVVAAGSVIAGRPAFTALRKNSELNSSATSPATPSSVNSEATGRDDPSPKFLPADTISPADTSSVQPGRISWKMCLAASGGSIFIAKAGYMASVFRLSPKTHPLPVKETVTRSPLSWVGDISGDRRRGHGCRGSHEDLGLGTAHPPGEVS